MPPPSAVLAGSSLLVFIYKFIMPRARQSLVSFYKKPRLTTNNYVDTISIVRILSFSHFNIRKAHTGKSLSL